MSEEEGKGTMRDLENSAGTAQVREGAGTQLTVDVAQETPSGLGWDEGFHPGQDLLGWVLWAQLGLGKHQHPCLPVRKASCSFV